jgi:hypothetical protein
VTKLWRPGDSIVLRGVVGSRVWLAQSVIVVRDTPDETALLLMPGAQYAFPEGYFRRRKGDYSLGTRWQETRVGDWAFRLFSWETNRFLMLLEPNQFYATCLIWHDLTNEFRSYYINFQLPYQRVACGFDTLDLDLDLVVGPDHAWHWKDEAAYQDACREGAILPAWIKEVSQSGDQVLNRIESQGYPFDGSWLRWQPDPVWQPPALPAGWQRSPVASNPGAR